MVAGQPFGIRRPHHLCRLGPEGARELFHADFAVRRHHGADRRRLPRVHGRADRRQGHQGSHPLCRVVPQRPSRPGVGDPAAPPSHLRRRRLLLRPPGPVRPGRPAGRPRRLGPPVRHGRGPLCGHGDPAPGRLPAVADRGRQPAHAGRLPVAPGPGRRFDPGRPRPGPADGAVLRRRHRLDLHPAPDPDHGRPHGPAGPRA